jgi:hypothetical protein
MKLTLPFTAVLALFACVGNSAHADDNWYVRVFSRLNELPRELSDKDAEYPYRSITQPLQITFILHNDSVFPPKGWSDDGYTHGLRIAASKGTKDGLLVTLAYSTDLYTQGIGATPKVDKLFTSDNILRFVIDNAAQGRAWFWRAEGGWQQLSADPNCHFIESSCQQIWFHDLLTKLGRWEPATVDIADGRGRQNGAIAGGAVGLQQAKKIGPIGLETREEAGVLGASLPGASSAHVRGDVGASYLLKGKLRLEVDGAIQAKEHALGTEYTPSVGLKVETNHWTLGIERMTYEGKAQNYQLYNLPSPNGRYDPIVSVGLTYRFQR